MLSQTLLCVSACFFLFFFSGVRYHVSSPFLLHFFFSVHFCPSHNRADLTSLLFCRWCFMRFLSCLTVSLFHFQGNCHPLPVLFRFLACLQLYDFSYFSHCPFCVSFFLTQTNRKQVASSGHTTASAMALLILSLHSLCSFLPLSWSPRCSLIPSPLSASVSISALPFSLLTGERG